MGLGPNFESVLGAARLGTDWAWAEIYRQIAGPVTGFLRARGVDDPLDAAGDVFFDVGANAGFHSLVAANRVGENGQVFAFEPNNRVTPLLEAQFSINSFSNCHVVAAAAADTDGEITFYAHQDAGLGAIEKDQGAGWKEGVTVPAVRLDSFVQQEHVPAVIKIDVEGAEDVVVEGALELLKSAERCPVLLIELHEPEAARRLEGSFAEAGYRMYAMAESPDDAPAISLSSLTRTQVQHIVAASESDTRFPGRISHPVMGSYALAQARLG